MRTSDVLFDNSKNLNKFNLNLCDNKARLGVFHSAHGDFDTPNFMPVGTRASVRGVDCERLKECGAQVMLVNTYHLWLRPGEGLVRELGGIHNFSGWSGPILSDSGGFQVFSLKGLRRISDEGVEFRSHIDGALCFLSPEKAIAIQEELGVDIAMVLDECPAGELGLSETNTSLDLTIRWAKRCLAAKKRSDMALFGITQGGVHRELRTRAALELAQLPFDGMAIGGLSVGEKKELMYEVLSYHVSQLPSDKIRYLMGVGTPQDLIQGVSEGVDIFDCVMPSRAGRFGRAFVNGKPPFINIKNSTFAKDKDPIDKSCNCLACRNYSKGYIHHLFKVSEMLGPQLISIHNLTHYLSLMQSIREAIRLGRFGELYRQIISCWCDEN